MNLVLRSQRGWAERGCRTYKCKIAWKGDLEEVNHIGIMEYYGLMNKLGLKGKDGEEKGDKQRKP